MDETTDIEDIGLYPPAPLEGVWWKFGLSLATAQILGWIFLGFHFNPDLDLGFAFRTGYAVYGAFILMSFLPFLLGRLGMRGFMWLTLVGVLLGIGAYYLLALYEPTRRVPLLPYYAFLQLSAVGFLLGFLWQFGAYVFRKIRE